MLPSAETQKLCELVKKLVTNWAEEERALGKNCFYWNIMSNPSMKKIAEQVPTTIDDLKAMSILGENIVKEYGDRIVKIVLNFVASNKLDSYLSRRPAKRAKVTEEAPKPATTQTAVQITDDSEDEFDKLDLSGVNINVGKPMIPVSSGTGDGQKSKFF